jgi:hypothetical protein
MAYCILRHKQKRCTFSTPFRRDLQLLHVGSPSPTNTRSSRGAGFYLPVTSLTPGIHCKSAILHLFFMFMPHNGIREKMVPSTWPQHSRLHANCSQRFAGNSVGRPRAPSPESQLLMPRRSAARQGCNPNSPRQPKAFAVDQRCPRRMHRRLAVHMGWITQSACLGLERHVIGITRRPVLVEY